VDVHGTAGQVLCAIVAGIPEHFHIPSPHACLFTPVSRSAIVAGIPPADDSAPAHLPAEPAIGVPEDLDSPPAHEIPAVHPDIAFNTDHTGVHVLADPFDAGRVSFQYHLDLIGAHCRTFHKNPEDIG
jgi:hypothetical protein